MRVEAVEPPTPGGKMIRQFGVEEVVGVAVHRQHHRRRRGRVGGADQGGEQLTFPVGIGTQGQGGLPIPGEYVIDPFGLHCRHGPTLTGIT